ncbi:uncharacterized protein DMENIID0001_100420 [Sergentomyia squamirostris]
MSEYRCVNYYELCRLCTGSHGTKVHIFSEDGKKRNLFNKITGCLPIQLSEKDKLPKIVCGQCLQQVESIVEFRETCVNAQSMLESCLNSTKLRNEGKVYIKDVVAKRNVLPTGTPTLSPTLVTVRQAQVGGNAVKTVTTIPSNVTQISAPNSDFLSSIIQAVGIPSVEEGTLETQLSTQIPQYTLTLDGQTLKANPIQYKIKEEPTMLTTTTEQQQQQQSAFAQVDEFLKLKTTTQIGSTQITRRTVKAAVKATPIEPPKPKKPKINLVLTAPPASQHQAKIITSPSITTTPVTMGTSPTKTVSLQDLKIFSPTNKCFLPITLKDGSTDQQILTQIDAKNIVLPAAVLQMKLQPQITTVDGQPVVQLTPTAIPTSLSISSNSGGGQMQPIQTMASSSLAEAVQNAEIIFTTSSAQFQQQTQQHQVHQTNPGNTVRLTSIANTPVVTMSSPKTSTPATITIQTSPTKPHLTKVTQPVQQAQRRITFTKKIPATQATVVKSEPVKAQIVTNTTSLAPVSTVPATTTTTVTTIKSSSIPPNCTTCDNCGKTFKRKEHLIQHLKLHAGLRPFKCEEPGCNKTFSRKEHLMRHVVSHTGKKMFSCEFCHKFFSRKDNLNKHKRTHSEYVNNGPFYCEICQKSFVVKMYYVQHKAMHEKEGTATSDDNKSKSKEMSEESSGQSTNGGGGGGIVMDEGASQEDPTQDVEQEGSGEEQHHEETLVVNTPSSQPQIMQVHFTPVTSGQNQVATAMGSHDTTVLTLPSNISNFVTLNSTQFVTSSDVMGHFKIENN